QLPSGTARLPIHKKVQRLLAQRKEEISSGIDGDAQSIRKTLSELKTITDQFQLIYANVTDQVKILFKLKR
ncbi:MAG: hypothetical protein WCF67_21435, partial [Chitinophagaceae bacterium]